MITSPYFFKQHKFTIISTGALLAAAFPVLLSSAAAYTVLAGIIAGRGLLLYGAVAHSLGQTREEYASRVLESDTFRRALAKHMSQIGGAERIPLTA